MPAEREPGCKCPQNWIDTVGTHAMGHMECCPLGRKSKRGRQKRRKQNRGGSLLKTLNELAAAAQRIEDRWLRMDQEEAWGEEPLRQIRERYWGDMRRQLQSALTRARATIASHDKTQQAGKQSGPATQRQRSQTQS